MSDGAIRAKVQEYLEESNALDKVWRRPITAGQLQAEIDRMAMNSHDPQILGELFAALGNDPLVIAETLARQTLGDRLIRHWYASATRFHADVRKKAEAALAMCAHVGCMKSLGGDRVPRGSTGCGLWASLPADGWVDSRRPTTRSSCARCCHGATARS
jgi:hypothetical protein